MSINAFQRRDTGKTYEVIGEDDAGVTLRAYDEDHTVSVVTRAEIAARFDPTARSIVLTGITSDGVGGVRIAAGDSVLHLDAAMVAAVAAAAGVP